MRARGIKPGFFKNEELMECPYEARLLYIGLWCLADRRGRMEYRPKRIKIELFPGDSVDVESMVQVLCKHGFIRIYSASGLVYLDIPAFERNQNPHKNERESEIPSFDRRDIQTENGDSHSSTVQAPEQHNTSMVPLVLTPDSGLLTPDCLIPDNSDLRSPRSRAPTIEASVREHVAPFEEFWRAYPNKKGKGSAQAWWKRNRPNAGLGAQMLAAIQDQQRERQSLRRSGLFCPEWPHGSTWLNGRRWEDSTKTDDEITAEKSNARTDGDTNTNGASPSGRRNWAPDETSDAEYRAAVGLGPRT